MRPYHPYRRYNLRPRAATNPTEDGVYSGPQEIVSQGNHLTLTYGQSESSSTKATVKCNSSGNIATSAPIVAATGTSSFNAITVTNDAEVDGKIYLEPTQTKSYIADGDMTIKSTAFNVDNITVKNTSGFPIVALSSASGGEGKLRVNNASGTPYMTMDASTGLTSLLKVQATSTAANNSIITAKSYTNGNTIVDVKEDASGHGQILTKNSSGTTVNTLDTAGIVSTELLKVAGTGDRRVQIESTNALNAPYIRLKNPSWEWDIVLDGAAGSVPGAMSFQDNGSGYVRPFHISTTGVKIGGTSNATMAVYDGLYRSNVTFASSALADETKSTDVCTLQLKCVRVGQQVTICLDNGPDDTFDLTTDGAGYLKMKQVDVAAFAAAGSGRFLPNVNVFVPIVAYPGNGTATACLMIIFTTGDIYLYGNTASGNFPAGVSLVRFLSTQYIKDSGY